MNSLQGKTALVTGGSRGIGAATAIALAQLGADIAITYAVSADKAARVVDVVHGIGVRGTSIQTDGDSARAAVDAVAHTVAELGRIDILVNNAGVFTAGPIEDVSVEEVDQILDLDTRAVYLTSQAALRDMADGSRIITIGSNLGERVPVPGVTLYAMAKSALVGFTRGLAREMGPRGITVNLVQPGPTDTDMNPADGPNGASSRAWTANNRHGTPGDVAAAVAYLAGPAGRHITGAILAVDGGVNA